MRRKEQLEKLIQKTLSTIFLVEIAKFLGNTFLSVTAVELSRDSSLAKVYLSSSLHPDKKEAILEYIIRHKHTIRRLLGQKIGSKVRKLPDLKFINDNSVLQGDRVTALINQLEVKS